MTQNRSVPIALQRAAEGVLFAGNVLLLFFLFFESYIQIPLWLSPLGRMHPLLLHFPIVLLVLLLVMELFVSKEVYQRNPILGEVSRILLLATALGALFTAIMGLFLSLEEGYTGDLVVQHKWSGSALAVFLGLFYFLRGEFSLNPKVTRIALSLSVVLLVVASHWGATLTHGENFLFAPIAEARQETVSLEDAVVFDHMVMPILERKCNSCHNPRKSKGELIMTTKEGLLRGGKSGPLMLAGNPDASLMLERIYLPLDDEEHMPPKGKTQLTEEEIRLLELWIAQDANFETRVAQLEPQNELFQLASIRFTQGSQVDDYTFAPASKGTIDKLNHAFRSVSPLSKDSPALDARVFSKAEYSSNVLEELLEVKTQLVYLNLSEMPVTDQDLSIVAQFENLNRLNLNFTSISGAGLNRLADMPNLHHLSVSGTAVDDAGVRAFLGNSGGLKTLYIWDTGLSVQELDQLERDFPTIRILSGREIRDMDVLQLNLPVLATPSPIFGDSMVLALGHPIRDVMIRYTLDGTEPDSLTGMVYKAGEKVLREGNVIKAKAFKEGWLGSDLAILRVYQNKYNPDTVYLLSRLNRVHPANGPQTFFDGEMGSFNANSPAWANNWAGFLNNDLELLLEYKEPVPVSSIAMRVLVEPETVIFPPTSIELWGGDHPDRLRLLGRVQPKQPTQLGKPYIDDLSLQVPTFEGTFFKVIAKPVASIPDWSPRKGRAALLLVDEMFVN
ncbi:hypothetical protein ADIS_1216 [Lunatimonas lonarensis]|uniref:Uncharacterized protein n=1 Tax=Lunatimonas lonarensis TaxID=1232681 RepID=R7ZWF9_9BACT|nr:c-type cytochrome domain-containing protein [Lunatimonas lonarensis]EON78353.1 hypothetical protein ADIS_1216 [Lunatimonas lonarensis]